jgi:hypothetical protein
MAKTVVCVMTAPFWVAPYLIFKRCVCLSRTPVPNPDLKTMRMLVPRSVRGVVRKVARAKHKADQRRAMRTAPPAA